MVNILRTTGLVCAMLIATVSLYFFTIFWSGISSYRGYEKTITEITQQVDSIVNPIKKVFGEKHISIKK